MNNPHRCTFNQLIRTEILLWNHCDAELRHQLGLPLTHLEGLRVIAHTPSCRVQDVATGLLITVGAASKLVDRLEAAQHCRRASNPDDRRSSLLIVTKTGHSALRRFNAIMDRLLSTAFGTTHLQQLNASLEQIEHRLLGSA